MPAENLIIERERKIKDNASQGLFRDQSIESGDTKIKDFRNIKR